jgi:hypothetical protein
VPSSGTYSAKGFTQYGHRLNGLAAGRKLDPTLRQSFIGDGSVIEKDLGTLRSAVHCPDDALPG